MKRLKLGTNKKLETKYRRYLESFIKKIDRTRFTDAEYREFQAYLKNMNKLVEDMDLEDIKKWLYEFGIELINESFSKFNIDEDPTDDLLSWLDMFIDTNVLLVTDLMESEKRKIQIIISDGVSQGRTIKQIKQKINESIGGSMKRCETIAITETAKAMSFINRSNLQSFGIEEVEWSSAHDKRVRRCHLARDGVKYDITKGCYSKCDGNYLQVGMEVRCRCAMVAILT